jgi:hypothetical protein
MLKFLHKDKDHHLLLLVFQYKISLHLLHLEVL